MAKQARRQRREVAGRRRAAGSAAVLADRARDAAARLERAMVEVLKSHDLEMDPPAVAGRQIRQDLLEAGWTWEDWSYLPYPLALSVLSGCESSTSVDERITFGATFAALAAWEAGRIAVRFDPDLAAAVISTPLTGELPVTLIQRLPAWAMFLDLPWLDEGDGVFVSLSPASGVSPDGSPVSGGLPADELWMLFVGSGGALLITTLWLTGGSLEESIARMDGLGFSNAELRRGLSEAFGRPYEEVIRAVLCLVLYLCSAESDTTRRAVPELPGPGRKASDVTVVSAGYRVGAALRSAQSSSGTRAGGGPSPAAHLRRAHWHSYWVGPRSRDDLRRLEVRWLSPILVNADRADDTVTVRSVAPRPS